MIKDNMKATLFIQAALKIIPAFLKRIKKLLMGKSAFQWSEIT